MSASLAVFLLLWNNGHSGRVAKELSGAKCFQGIVVGRAGSKHVSNISKGSWAISKAPSVISIASWGARETTADAAEPGSSEATPKASSAGERTVKAAETSKEAILVIVLVDVLVRIEVLVSVEIVEGE